MGGYSATSDVDLRKIGGGYSATSDVDLRKKGGYSATSDVDLRKIGGGGILKLYCRIGVFCRILDQIFNHSSRLMHHR